MADVSSVTLAESQLPEVILAADTPIHVIGDSLSASSDDGTSTWPELVGSKCSADHEVQWLPSVRPKPPV
jgi:hypothetical protein